MRWERPLDDAWITPDSATADEDGVALGAAPRRVAVLLLPPVSLGTVGAIVDPLVAANVIAGRRYYDIQLVSADGTPVQLSTGLRLPVDAALHATTACHALIVASDIHRPGDREAQVLDQLSRLRRLGAAFGATRGGSAWLASAGLLDERRVAVHWEDLALLREQHPSLIHCTSLYEVDGDRFTASSTLAALDMMLFVIARQTTPQLADAIARQLGLDRIRPGHEKQSVPATSRIAQHPPKLSEALLIMEANLEEPLGSDEIANCVGISRRQLERLFKQSLGVLPSKYYQSLRLDRAHQLIVRTQKSIVQIGLSCGFSSGSHFASAYRTHFGTTPREDRARATLTGSTATAGAPNADRLPDHASPPEPAC
jgi:transcriptional regulator GlxA family with amidase domain